MSQYSEPVELCRGEKRGCRIFPAHLAELRRVQKFGNAESARRTRRASDQLPGAWLLGGLA